MIDTHCHINDDIYKNDPSNYIALAKESGVNEFLIIGYDLESSILAVNIAEQFDECFAMIGIHPSEAEKLKGDELNKLEELAINNKVLGIGEIGLDYYWEKDPKIHNIQKDLFIKQISLANKLNLPISIHCRDASEDCLEILKNNIAKRGGIMHCYAGSVEMAKDFIKLGFLLGFGGTTTFKNAIRPKEVIASIPSTAYVLETDAPYLTPEPFRGQANHSKYLYLVRNKISELRNVSNEVVDQESTANFNRVFRK